jgi:hypothetical protein
LPTSDEGNLEEDETQSTAPDEDESDAAAQSPSSSVPPSPVEYDGPIAVSAPPPPPDEYDGPIPVAQTFSSIQVVPEVPRIEDILGSFGVAKKKRKGKTSDWD